MDWCLEQRIGNWALAGCAPRSHMRLELVEIFSGKKVMVKNGAVLILKFPIAKTCQFVSFFQFSSRTGHNELSHFKMSLPK